jgi:hypothetical protein
MILRELIKVVPTPEATIFTIISPTAFGRAVFLHNIGTMPITYKFQQANDNLDSAYTDILAAADTVNPSGTIPADGVVLVTLASASNFVRLRANASGAPQLKACLFEYSRFTSGNLPIYCA